MRRLLVTANVPSSPILVTLMMEALGSSETSVLTTATWRHIPGYGTLYVCSFTCYAIGRSLDTDGEMRRAS
jgi:hypothetical protein